MITEHQVFTDADTARPRSLANTYVGVDPASPGDRHFVRFLPRRRGGGQRFFLEALRQQPQSAGEPVQPRMQPALVAFIPLGGEWYALEGSAFSLDSQILHSVARVRANEVATAALDQVPRQRLAQLAADHGFRFDLGVLRGANHNRITPEALRAMLDGARSLAPLSPTPLTAAAGGVPAELEARSYAAYFDRHAPDRLSGAEPAGMPEFEEYLGLLAERGQPWARYTLARRRLAQGHRDAARLNAVYAVAAGVGRGRYVLGALALEDQRDPENDALAVTLFQQAAAEGETRAMLALAHSLLGAAPERQQSAAEAGVAWLRRAAAGGLPQAQVELGRRLATGTGMARDDAAAYEWFSKAGAARDAEGMAWLGWALANGRGVTAEPSRATDLFRQAASLGLPWARWHYGERLATGVGTRPDRREGLRWLRRAVDGGVQGAAETLRRLEAGPPRSEDDGEAILDDLAREDDARSVELARLHAELHRRLARIEVEQLGPKRCDHLACSQLPDGRQILRAPDGPEWFFEDGRLAPRELWLD